MKETLEKLGLEQYGIREVEEVVYNPSWEELYKAEMDPRNEGFERGVETEFGAVNVDTGIFTGRSPKDKYVVLDEQTRDTVWWQNETAKSSDNKAISREVWDHGYRLASEELSGKRLYVVDCYSGATPENRLKVRFIMEVAWQAHFVKNMFIRPSEEELKDFEPDFLVLTASKATNPNWKEQGLHSEVFVFFNLTERMCVIGGTWYGGELKKGIFSVMNYYLPLKGVASMHCSANVCEDHKTAIYFGLSGTGKTTLSTDPKRKLIGDDEHGWDDEGIFNLEGGCYAKTIDLSEEKEPDIYQAVRRNALLENVTIGSGGKVDYSDASRTQNTRVSYPIFHINNIVRPLSKAGHAKRVIFLTADAYGVLPPVSKLSPEQMQYHFLSGFTAKLAGTERGIDEPVPTFSACFGAAFLMLHPTKYAEELLKRFKKAKARAYLVNTGWNGSGERISLAVTRRIIDAILDGSIEQAPVHKIPLFNLAIPGELHDVPKGLLDPRNSYQDQDQWYRKARQLATYFVENFKQFTDNEQGRELEKAGPHLF